MENDPYLTPTDDEVAMLRQHVCGWDDLDPWGQSVCLAILRGQRTVGDIVGALGVTREQVLHAVRPLIGRGLLYDGSEERFLLK